MQACLCCCFSSTEADDSRPRPVDRYTVPLASPSQRNNVGLGAYLRPFRPAPAAVLCSAMPRSPEQIAKQFFDDHSKSVLSFFRASLPLAQSDATDLLQQTFTELLMTLRRQRGLEIEQPRAFVFKIAHRCLYSYLERQQKRPPPKETPDPETPSTAEADDQQFILSQRDEHRLLLRAMRRLTPQDNAAADEGDGDSVGLGHLQQLLYLRVWGSFKLAQLAEIFDIPPGTVASRLRRATKLLHIRVKELAGSDRNAVRTSTTVLDAWRRNLEEEASRLIPTPP